MDGTVNPGNYISGAGKTIRLPELLHQGWLPGEGYP